MSDNNPLERLALELAQIRQELIALHRDNGTRLSRADVCARLCIHRNTLPSYVKDRGFPKPSRDGKWLLSDILEWEQDR